MKQLKALILFLFCIQTYSQNQGVNWYFSEYAGINFDLVNDTVTSLNDGQIGNDDSATISDKDGNLLFYTRNSNNNNSNVYNKNHELMPNGRGMLPVTWGRQSRIIIPAPKNPNIYYIFAASLNQGFIYAVIDMTLNGGLGDVIEKNVIIRENCIGITALLKDCESQSIWIITSSENNQANNLSFHSYELTKAGLNINPVTSNFFQPILSSYIIKTSPDGSTLATPISDSNSTNIGLFNFNKNTGVVSNKRMLEITKFDHSGLLGTINISSFEFSSNSKLLYINSRNANTYPLGSDNSTDPLLFKSTLTQFNLQTQDIQTSEYKVDERFGFFSTLQIGSNGKIYRTSRYDFWNGDPYLNVINNPNGIGATCNYIHQGIDISPNLSGWSLPPYFESIYNKEEDIDIINNGSLNQLLTLCEGETYTLSYDDIPGAVYKWYKDGVLIANTTSSLLITESGTYELFFDNNNVVCTNGLAKILYYEIPVANQPSNILTCDNDNDAIWSYDFTSQDNEVLGAQDNTIYSVHYFESQDDADNNENEIIGIYSNTSNPKTIYARIHNNGNINCYDTTSFTLEVFNTPTANTIGDWEICDDDTDGNDMNGQRDFDLSTLNPVVLGTQNALQYVITYYNSQIDANSSNNPLPTNYYNTTPNTKEVFVRIENVDNTECYDTTSFNLIINLLPESFDSSLLQCDDDGNPDGFTLFNLTEANDDLTGGVTDRSTKFFLSLIDAQIDINEIDGNSFNNTLNPQTIFVQVINDITGCYSISKLLLDVTATDANDAFLSHCDDDGVEDGFYNFDLSLADTTVLNGLPITLTISYYETYEDSLLEQNKLNTSFTNTVAYSQTIYARIENDNACYGIALVELSIYELPNIETQFETLYCLNYFPQTITLDASLISNPATEFTYVWSTGETTQEIQINAPGTYTVTVANINDCNTQRTITVLPSNIATVENIEVIDVSSNNAITVIVSGEGDYEFSLNHINGPYQDRNFLENVPPGLHTIYVRDKNDCGIVNEIVSVIGFPKFFTPNGDSHNDAWHIFGINSKSQLQSEILIYDRYGKLLQKLNPNGTGWDGTFNGEDLPTNDYWFHVKLQDGRTFKSHFTLKR